MQRLATHITLVRQLEAERAPPRAHRPSAMVVAAGLTVATVLLVLALTAERSLQGRLGALVHGRSVR